MTRCAVRIAAVAMALASIGGRSPAAATPPDGGSISIDPKTADGVSNPSMQSFVNAAADALAAKGFVILADPGHAAYVGELTLVRAEVGTGLAKAPAGSNAVTPGGSPGGVGAGVTIPLSSGKSELVPLQRTRLELRIRKRGEDGVLWTGVAVTVRSAGTRKGTDDVVASDLSQAILRGYPIEPDGILGVP